MSGAFNILFVCTGNSCRSQMAEGWARHLGGESIIVRSSGIEVHGVNPNAIAVMKEDRVDISGQQTKQVTDAMPEQADLVITVCGHVGEHCQCCQPVR